MENLECPSVAERLYGLALIWQEANYNFVYFDHVPDLDWDAAYREFIPRVIAVDDVFSYYDLLERFVALLNDGHSGVIPPKALYQQMDRPKLTLMNIAGAPVVTNVSQSIAASVPIGSQLITIDGLPVEEYLLTYAMPVVCETTPHRRRDHAVARLLLGRQGSTVHCTFHTPGGECVEIDLLRNRHIDPGLWLRPSSVPDKHEFMYIDENVLSEAPLVAFEFKMLEGNLAYVALNTFMAVDSSSKFIDPSVVASFEEKLPILRGCSGIIIDLRKNRGGTGENAYSIASYFLRRPAEQMLVHSLKNIAMYRARGVNWKDTAPDQMVELEEWQREPVLCYRKQWFEEFDWGQVQPASEPLDCPIVILTSSETGSASEEFLMTLETGLSTAVRIGQVTAGTSGQPLIEELPGGGMVGICTVRMPWQERIAGKGIEPHVRIEPTVEDVIRHEDRVLQEAVRYLKESVE